MPCISDHDIFVEISLYSFVTSQLAIPAMSADECYECYESYECCVFASRILSLHFLGKKHMSHSFQLLLGYHL